MWSFPKDFSISGQMSIFDFGWTDKERNMKKGDTIKCNGAEDTIQTMHDLATEGIETDFYYVDGELYGLEVFEVKNNE